MPLGFRNASSIFEQALEIILSGVSCQGCLVYLNVGIVSSAREEKHFEDPEAILKLQLKTGVIIKVNNCEILKKKGDQLGHTILPGKVEAASALTKEIMETPFRSDKTSMESVFGASNVYRRFVADFSRIAWPFNAIFQTGVDFKWNNLTSEQSEALKKLKTHLANPPSLDCPIRVARTL